MTVREYAVKTVLKRPESSWLGATPDRIAGQLRGLQPELPSVTYYARLTPAQFKQAASPGT